MTKETIQDSKQLKDAIEVVNAILKTEKPYLVTMEEELSKIENGTMTICFRKYKGSVTDIVITDTTKRSVYKKQI